MSPSWSRNGRIGLMELCSLRACALLELRLRVCGVLKFLERLAVREKGPSARCMPAAGVGS